MMFWYGGHWASSSSHSPGITIGSSWSTHWSAFGLVLPPEIAALSMSGLSFPVAVNTRAAAAAPAPGPTAQAA